MAGFQSTTGLPSVVYADNIDFSGSDNPTAQITTNGQLIIGDSGGYPKIATPSDGTNISWTLGAGTIQPNITGQISVANGGTGLATLTDHSVLVGSGVGAITPIVVGATGELLCGVTGADPDFAQSSDGDFTFTSATATTNRTLTISNTDNTAASSPAHLQVTVGGATNTGDPYTNYLVTGAGTFSTGIDNSSTGDLFKITDGASPSAGNELLEMYSANTTANFHYNLLANVRTRIGENVAFEVRNLDDTDTSSHAILEAACAYGGGSPQLALVEVGEHDWKIINDVTDSGTLKFVVDDTGSPLTLLEISYTGIITVKDAYSLPIVDGNADEVLTTDGSGTVTWQAAGGGGGITYASTTVNATIVAGEGYIADKATLLTMTLPASPAINDKFGIINNNIAVGWRIAQNANQAIRWGNQISATGVGGYIESRSLGDNMELVCTVAGASARWQVIQSQGNAWIET